MPKRKYPFVQKETTRHEKTVYYFRRADGPRVRLAGEYESPEFEASYAKALAANPPPKVEAPNAKSLRWLYDRYRESNAWRDLAPATRRQRENIFRGVMEAGGNEPFSAFARADIEAGKDKRRETPSQARNFIDAMRGMFEWAVPAGHRKTDPTEGVKYPQRPKTEGFKAWDESDVAKYEATWPAKSRQRVWMHVLLYLGPRRGDAVLMGKQMIKDGVITFTTEKGRKKELIRVSRRIEPELAVTLAEGPTGNMALICGERGEPLTKESFGNMFKAACVAAGITDKSAHGLRKLSATVWAERGATEHELMALFGWLTPAMAALYTKTARRKMMALNAHDRLLGTAKEQPSPAPEKAVPAPEKIAG